MRSYAIATITVLLTTTACTTPQGLRATQLAAEATCAVGAAVDEAGEPVGGIIEAAACWLANYTAKRIARLESDQTESASVAETERMSALDAAAEELKSALDVCDPDDPTDDQKAAVSRAFAKCQALGSSD